ncbi:unnamed protein product [Bemisia tabaci]|uniref:Uncharacterized protein n=1 Tax=Bemisia tabaci TaxID=7038 RepID=A0A9P0F4Z0_BEMTA|nr:unnamed protein product [Bemisia tabaci]
MIPGIRPVDAYVLANGNANTFVLSQDALRRFTGMPASTHGAAIAMEAALRLMKGSLRLHESKDYLSSPRNFVAILPIIVSFKANRASYHVGAAYLTGQPRAQYNDS